MDWAKSDWENVYYGLKEIGRKMEQVMFECGNDERAKRFAQDCVDGIDTWIENCKRKGHIEEGTIDLTSSRKPIKSNYYSGNYDEDFDPADQGYTSYEGPGTVCRCPFPDGTMEEREFRDGWEMAARDNRDTDDLKNRRIANSRKLIKSSLEDRLLNLLEEFEEGYADTINRDVEEGSNGAYEQAFIEGFKNDYSLTNEDINKLKESVHEIWNEPVEDEIRDMGEMYGVPRGASSEEALKHFE